MGKSKGLNDLFVLSKCDYVVATHSSNFGRLVYELMHIIEPNPFYKFKSLDLNYFIHGYKSNILSRDYSIKYNYVSKPIIAIKDKY